MFNNTIKIISTAVLWIISIHLYSCGHRSNQKSPNEEINLTVNYNLSTDENLFTVFDGMRLSKNFSLKYVINSSKTFKSIKINLGNIDINPGNHPNLTGSKWINLESLGQDGAYKLNIIATDVNDNVIFKSYDIYKNLNLYDHQFEVSFDQEGGIHKAQMKIYDIGDINSDGFKDVFLHLDMSPKILLGPDFQSYWSVPDGYWQSSTYPCDINGDGINDVVLGNPWHDSAGLIKVFFGPMTADKNFSDEVEYHGQHVFFPQTGHYFENAGASLGCANLDGKDRDTLLHFNSNQRLINSLINVPSYLEFIKYDEDQNKLYKDYSAQNSTLTLDYSNGITGDGFTYFSNAADLNKDGYEDLYINGWYPHENHTEKGISILYGGKDKSYSISAAKHNRQIYSDHTQGSGINQYATSNSFSKANIHILDDVNLDGYPDQFIFHSYCVGQTAQAQCNYYDNSQHVEHSWIESDDIETYSELHTFFFHQNILMTKSFDLDGDGSLEYLMFKRDPISEHLQLDVKHTYNQELEHFLNSSDLGLSDYRSDFTALKNELGQRFLIFSRLNYQDNGDWQVDTPVHSIKFFRDE